MNDSSTPPIRLGIVGHGNLGRGVELAVTRNPDLRTVGIFTRRDPAQVQPRIAGTPVQPMQALDDAQEAIDVLVLCGGSRTDLPQQSPALAARFNLVDSFDTHARIPEHFAAVDAAARAGGTTALISAGWDPGLFSVQRVMGEAMLAEGTTHTFWGKGVSQGHSDALRRVPGVAAAVQYTIPVDAAVEHARRGEQAPLSTRQKHTRECFVVLAAGADAAAVRQAIVTMPDYFADYGTRVHFVGAEELARDHAHMPHGGFVIRSGHSSPNAAQVIEYRLQLASNPEFTASVLVAYARAVHRLHRLGQLGAKTVFDVPPGLLSRQSVEELRRQHL